MQNKARSVEIFDQMIRATNEEGGISSHIDANRYSSVPGFSHYLKAKIALMVEIDYGVREVL